jgi:hypothetical protein
MSFSGSTAYIAKPAITKDILQAKMLASVPLVPAAHQDLIPDETIAPKIYLCIIIDMSVLYSKTITTGKWKLALCTHSCEKFY